MEERELDGGVECVAINHCVLSSLLKNARHTNAQWMIDGSISVAVYEGGIYSTATFPVVTAGPRLKVAVNVTE